MRMPWVFVAASIACLALAVPDDHSSLQINVSSHALSGRDAGTYPDTHCDPPVQGEKTPHEVYIGGWANGYAVPISGAWTRCTSGTFNGVITIPRDQADGAQFEAWVRGGGRRKALCVLKYWPDKSVKPDHFEGLSGFYIGEGNNYLRPCGIRNQESVRCGAPFRDAPPADCKEWDERP